MSCQDIVVQQDNRPVIVQQPKDKIVVQQTVQNIRVCAQNPVSNFVPFFLTATVDGQVNFTLPFLPLSIWVAINGTAQAQAKTPTPDFTINGLVLTFSDGLDQGDIVFGMIQVVA